MIHFLALGLGVAYATGFAPFEHWLITLAASAGFFWVIQISPKPLLSAWLFGVGKYGLGVSWVYVSIHTFGNASIPLAVFLVSLFVCGMALFCVPVAGLFRWFSTDGSYWRSILAFVLAWSVMDWMLTWFLTGFPWLFPGFALVDTVLGHWAPLAGVMGVSFVALLSLAALTIMIMHKKVRLDLALMVLIPWLVGWGLQDVEWVQPGSLKTAALVQNNLDQKRKWMPAERQVNMDKNMSLSQPYWGVDLMVWPEAAITEHALRAPRLLEQLDRVARQSNTNLIVGVPGIRETADGAYSLENLAVGLGPASGRFAKHHLVPFGDYVPFEGVLRGLIEFFNLPMSHARPGGRNQANIQLSFGAAAMAICYEVAYGESMRRYAADAQVLLTISNDTWFGASIGPHQHLQIARMRAAENGRWLLRATQNGITAIVDHRGREISRLPQFVGATLVGEFSTMMGRTPYNRLGDWPLLATLVVLGGALWYAKRTTQAPGSGQTSGGNPAG